MGNYQVSLRKEGYLDVTKQVEVREGQEAELLFEMLTIEGSTLEQARRRKTAKLLFGTATFVAAATGGYFQYSSMQLADEYSSATKDAARIYDRMEQHDLISYVAFGVAVPLGVMAIVRSVQQRNLERQVNLVAAPVHGGGVLSLRLKF